MALKNGDDATCIYINILIFICTLCRFYRGLREAVPLESRDLDRNRSFLIGVVTLGRDFDE